MRTLILSLLLVVVLPGESSAQERKKRRKMGEILVEGEVQKPQVTMFVNRQNLNTDAGLVLKQSFIPRIVESVEQKTF
jgi:hypothetical protein